MDDILNAQDLNEFKSIAEQIELNGHTVKHDNGNQFHKRQECDGYVLVVNGGEAFICSACGEVELG